jgi:hypothetical protein
MTNLLWVYGKGAVTMNKQQYNNIIEHSLQYDCKHEDDSLDTARTIFNNMGVPLPQGTIKEVYDTLSTNNYMGWRECTIEEAIKNTNSGIATIGINEDKIIVFSAEDEEQTVTQTETVKTLNDNTPARTVSGLKYFTDINETSTEWVYCCNRYLTKTEMKVNAQCILDYLRCYGWTKKAICAMLGNMEQESNINPGVWQDLNEGDLENGYGLVLWSPATKYIDWAESKGWVAENIYNQLQRILYEVENNSVQWEDRANADMTFKQFTQSNESLDWLTEVFLRNYEKAGTPKLDKRISNAKYWYDNLI